MKRTQEILGLPIVSIFDGIEVGKVKSIIINADKGAIDYIVVDSGIQILSARVIPTDNILGIGEYAMTIENDSSINDISKIPAAIDLLQKNIQVKGTKVLTKKGRLIGEIGDIYIDEDECCKIIGLEYIADITQKRIRMIPRDSVITFGRNLVVVTDDVESTLLDRAAQLISADKSVDAEKKNLIDSGTFNAQDDSEYPLLAGPASDDSNGKWTDELEAIRVKTEIAVTEDAGAAVQDMGDLSINADKTEDLRIGSMEKENAGSSAESVGYGRITPNIPDSSAASLFEQRQRQYLNGRKVTKTIADRAGNIIINEGTVINDEIIDLAKLNGKMIELVMNNKA